jgi:DNA transformation protein
VRWYACRTDAKEDAVARNDPFRDAVLQRLAALPALRCRAMFGGYGLYTGERFFGIVYRGRLYFRTTEETREEYALRGSRPFRPSARQTLRAYYEVPACVQEDPAELVAWARAAAAE